MKRKSGLDRKVGSNQVNSSSNKQSSRRYSIGYGRPPLGSRFKPGASGNAKGRPKNSKNLRTLIREAMTTTISVKEGSASRRVSKLEGVVLRQLQNALKGSDRSALAVIKMAMQMGFLEDPNDTVGEDNSLSAADAQILEHLLTRRRESKRR